MARLAAQNAEPAFNLIKPGSVRWRKVQMHVCCRPMSSRYTYCQSAPSGPFFGQQGRKLAPEDATAVVVVEKFGAVNPARRSLVEKCRRRHRQERRHEVEPPAAPSSTEKIGDGG